MPDTGVGVGNEPFSPVGPTRCPAASFQFPPSSDVWLPVKDMEEVTGNQNSLLVFLPPARTVSQSQLWGPSPTWPLSISCSHCFSAFGRLLFTVYRTPRFHTAYCLQENAQTPHCLRFPECLDSTPPTVYRRMPRFHTDYCLQENAQIPHCLLFTEKMP